MKQQGVDVVQVLVQILPAYLVGSGLKPASSSRRSPIRHSPGLFSREWIETGWVSRMAGTAFILPAYLVGSGLKRDLVQEDADAADHSPGLFSREWIETDTLLMIRCRLSFSRLI